MKTLYVSLAVLIIFFLGPISYLLTYQEEHWSKSSRESAGLAAVTDEAVIQVYAANTHGWRGAFAVHTWFSIKESGENEYTVIEKLGWLYFKGLDAVSFKKDLPDRYWFGSKPDLILEIKGIKADALIPKIKKAALEYPYNGFYRYWPGPNSNTFVAFVARSVPELNLVMPPKAVGKDFLPWGNFIAKAPSGSGYQFSIYGLFGLLISYEEGVQINILGLEYGFGIKNPSIILPGFGTLGF